MLIPFVMPTIINAAMADVTEVAILGTAGAIGAFKTCSSVIAKTLTACNTAQIRQTEPLTEIPRLMCNGLVLACAIFRK